MITPEEVLERVDRGSLPIADAIEMAVKNLSAWNTTYMALILKSLAILKEEGIQDSERLHRRTDLKSF